MLHPAQATCLSNALGYSVRLSSLRSQPAIARALDQTSKNIRALKLTRNPEAEKLILDSVEDPQLKKGFGQALKELHDSEDLIGYIHKLQLETFDRMLNSGDAQLVKMAQQGKLDKGTMDLVLRSRAQSYGANVTILKTELADKDFLETLTHSFMIDEVFNSGGHGIYTHILQQDMLYPIIARAAGVSVKDVMKFMGTPKGNVVWNALFDDFEDPISALAHAPDMRTPDGFNRAIMQNNLPLP